MMKSRLFSCFIVFVSIFLNLYGIFCDFVFDDLSAIVNNKDVTGNSSVLDLLYNDFWGTSMAEESSHKSYRPLTVLTFRANYFVFGSPAWSFHLVNVLLYGLACFLVFHTFNVLVHLCFTENDTSTSKKKVNVIKYLVQPDNDTKERIVSVATLLFAVHPVHVDAVISVVGRAELLSAIFFMLTILFYLKLTAKSIFLSFLFCLLAMASKEQGITVLAVCALLDIIIVNKLTVDEFCLILVSSLTTSRRTKYKPLLIRVFLSTLFILILLLGRYTVMHGAMPHFTAFDNPAAAASFPTRHMTYNYLLPVNAWLLLNPSKLLCDWTMGTIPLIESFFDIRNVATFIFWLVYILLGSSVFFHGPISRMCSASIALLTLPFLPASNLLFPVGFVVAERVLFLPSAGFCLLVATGAWVIKSKYKCDRLIRLLVYATLFSHSLKTVHRSLDWKNEMELFKSGLKVTQRNAKLWNNVGHAYEHMEEWRNALHYFTQASIVEPKDIGAHTNVGRVHERLHDKRSAESAYRIAKSLLPKANLHQASKARVAPSSLQVFLKLAKLVKEENRFSEALALYDEVIAMRPTFVDAHINRGELLTRMNRSSEALECYRVALQLKPTDISDIYFNIGVVSSSMGNATGAVEAYTLAIANNPNHVKALFNSAVIFQETRDPSLLLRARSRVERVLKLEPNNVLAMTLLGAVCMDLNEYENAIGWWKKALTVEPRQKTCLFNLALIYSKVEGKTKDCIDAIKKLLHHHPNHVKGLLLYGDVLLNKVRNIELAQSVFAQIKATNPSNIEGQHNYCVTMVEQGKLLQAEECLLQVYQMAPREDYIQENLARVRRQRNLWEIRERKVQEKKETNFNVVRNVPDNQPSYEEKSLPQDEDVIYVARPDAKKDVFKEAKAIYRSLQDMNDNDVDSNLVKATKAVARLKEISEKLKLQVKQQHSSSKQSALEFLDDLESQIK